MSRGRNRLQKVVNWHSLATSRPLAPGSWIKTNHIPTTYMAWWPAVQLPSISLIVKEYPWEASVSQWETLLQGTLQDQQLHPFSKFPACFRQQADLLKSEGRVQSN
jgi:hypothetical protein